jgi:hypothetical protein
MHDLICADAETLSFVINGLIYRTLTVTLILDHFMQASVDPNQPEPPSKQVFPLPKINIEYVKIPIPDHIGKRLLPEFRKDWYTPSSIDSGPEINSIKSANEFISDKAFKGKPLLPCLSISECVLDHLNEAQRMLVKEVINTENFQDAPNLRYQVKLLNDHLRENQLHPACTYAELAKVIGLKHEASFIHQVKVGKKAQHIDGRPTVIHKEAEELIMKVAFERYKQKDSISIYEMIDLLLDHFGLAVTADTLKHHLQTMPNLKIATGVAIDHNRAEVNYQDIKDWYKELQSLIAKVPRDFIFNVDETGCDEYVDSKDVAVLIPTAHKGDKVDIPVHRQCKRATLTACVVADGSVMKPFVILPRETIDEEVYRQGFTPEKVVFIHHIHAFMTKKLFELWMIQVFIPDLQQRRERTKYQGPAILIMDQFSGHQYENLAAQCGDNNVVIKYLVPHTSHLCQPLDLVTFSSMKRNLNTIKPKEGMTMQSNKIFGMITAWEKSTSIMMTMSTFSAAGIVSQRGYLNDCYYCSVDLSVSIHLKELDNMISMQNMLTPKSTPATSTEVQETSREVKELVQMRPSLYPPSTTWSQEPQKRIQLESFPAQAVAAKKTKKKPREAQMGSIPSSGSVGCWSKRQLTLTQSSWGKLKGQKSVGWDGKPCSPEPDLHPVPETPLNCPKETSTTPVDDAHFLS